MEFKYIDEKILLVVKNEKNILNAKKIIPIN